MEWVSLKPCKVTNGVVDLVSTPIYLSAEEERRNVDFSSKYSDG
jgi:hypothetical protein